MQAAFLQRRYREEGVARLKIDFEAVENSLEEKMDTSMLEIPFEKSFLYFVAGRNHYFQRRAGGLKFPFVPEFAFGPKSLKQNESDLDEEMPTEEGSCSHSLGEAAVDSRGEN